jgi:hypothetical protein
MKSEIEEEIDNAEFLLNGLVCTDSPETMTVNLNDDRKAVFKLVELEDGTKRYKFDHLEQ